MPASSHLSLILSLISSQPSIKPLLLSLIPQLDLNQCMETLETKLRAVEATVPITASSATRPNFGFGSQIAVAPAAKERDDLYVWNRVKGGVAEYCSMVGFCYSHAYQRLQPTSTSFCRSRPHLLELHLNRTPSTIYCIHSQPIYSACYRSYHHLHLLSTQPRRRSSSSLMLSTLPGVVGSQICPPKLINGEACTQPLVSLRGATALIS